MKGNEVPSHCIKPFYQHRYSEVQKKIFIAQQSLSCKIKDGSSSFLLHCQSVSLNLPANQTFQFVAGSMEIFWNLTPSFGCKSRIPLTTGNHHSTSMPQKIQGLTGSWLRMSWFSIYKEVYLVQSVIKFRFIINLATCKV